MLISIQQSIICGDYSYRSPFYAMLGGDGGSFYLTLDWGYGFSSGPSLQTFKRCSTPVRRRVRFPLQY